MPYVLFVFRLFLLPMEEEKRVEVGQKREGEGKAPTIHIDMSDSEDVIITHGPLPRTLKRERGWVASENLPGLPTGDSDDDEGPDYKEYAQSLSYSHQDDPIEIDDHSNHNNDLGIEDLAKDLQVFDRSLPPDPLWYINHWKLPPKQAIALLRKAASYLAQTSGEKRVRAPYKQPRTKK